MLATRTHAEDRVTERLTDAGLDPATIDRVWAVTSALATRLPGATAVRLLKLPARVNEAWGARSNGDAVWAVYRDHRVCTVFLRRSTQPSTPEAFDVERVLFLRPGAFELEDTVRPYMDSVR